MSYIYLIKNIINNKVYVGKTSCFINRKNEHLKRLKAGKHVNTHLQSSYNKYGKDFFEFCILEECDNDIIDSREKHWIIIYKSTSDNNGYNLTYGGDGGIATKETKEKQSRKQDSFKKKVYGFTKTGYLFKVWDSIKACCKELSVNSCDIKRTITQKQYSCKGYILQNIKTFDKRLSPSEKAKLRLRKLNGTFI